MDQGTLFKLLDKNVSGMNETTILELYRSLQIFDTYFQEESIVLTALYVPVFLLGFLGNFIVIILVLTNQQLRNSTNLYLCNMAAADLFGKVPKLFKLPNFFCSVCLLYMVLFQINITLSLALNL